MVGIRPGRELGNQLVVQKPGGRGLPGLRSADLSRRHQAIVAYQSVEAPSPAEWPAGGVADCRALAHPGDVTKSTLSRFHNAQRSARISRLPVALFHKP